MPLVAYKNLPTFDRLRAEGRMVLPAGRAKSQEIRELHIGLLNIMPDAALQATERQFFRLIGESNRIAQFYIHPFTLPEIQRGDEAQAYINEHYEPFETLQNEGLDALIITGANVTDPDLTKSEFWQPLQEIMSWAYENVTSTLCSCLATHAIMEFQYKQKREPLEKKLWGIYPHRLLDRHHPLTRGMNTAFDVPYSRHNTITRAQFEAAGLTPLCANEFDDVHIAASPDGFRQILFQGHPEYDTISLYKEYKREVNRFIAGERKDYPPCPSAYFDDETTAMLDGLETAIKNGQTDWPLSDSEMCEIIENSWSDSARSMIANWIGLVYQLTNMERKLPFMDGVDKEDPLAGI